jgi:hypothetical protein
MEARHAAAGGQISFDVFPTGWDKTCESALTSGPLVLSGLTRHLLLQSACGIWRLTSSRTFTSLATKR